MVKFHPSPLNMATATSGAANSHRISSIASNLARSASATGVVVRSNSLSNVLSSRTSAPARTVLDGTTSSASATAINSTIRRLVSNHTNAATTITTSIPLVLFNTSPPAINATAANRTIASAPSIIDPTSHCSYTYRTPVDTFLAHNTVPHWFRFAFMIFTTILQVLGVLALAVLLLVFLFVLISMCLQGIRRLRKRRGNKRAINGATLAREGRELDTFSTTSIHQSQPSLPLVESSEQRVARLSSGNREGGEAATYNLGMELNRAFDPNEEYGLHQAAVTPPGNVAHRQGGSRGQFSHGNPSYQYTPPNQTLQGQFHQGEYSLTQPFSMPSSSEQAPRGYPTSGQRYASYTGTSRVPESDRLPPNPSASEYQRMGGNPWV